MSEWMTPAELVYSVGVVLSGNEFVVFAAGWLMTLNNSCYADGQG
jgi:hypothetical protein